MHCSISPKICLCKFLLCAPWNITLFPPALPAVISHWSAALESKWKRLKNSFEYEVTEHESFFMFYISSPLQTQRPVVWRRGFISCLNEVNTWALNYEPFVKEAVHFHVMFVLGAYKIYNIIRKADWDIVSECVVWCISSE